MYAIESVKKVFFLLLLFVLAKRDQVPAYLIIQAWHLNCHVVCKYLGLPFTRALIQQTH